MKKHFPSITLLSLVTKFKFAHDILQICFNANINFFPQHLTFNATLLVILAFCITYNLQFLLWRGGGGGIDLNMNVTSAWTCIFFNWKTGQNIFVFKINYSDKWLWMKSQAKCKLTQQLLTLLGQQCCKLLCPCWQWCANACSNVGTCTSIERRMQPLRLWRPCVMRMHGPYNVGRAVQMDPTLLHFTSVISWQNKRNVGSCWLKTLTGFKLCTTTASNMQQHVTSNNVGSCWPTMLNSFELGLTQKNKVWSVTQLLPGPVFINLSLWH